MSLRGRNVRERHEPNNRYQEEIKAAVDAKARAIQAGLGRWDDSIISEMKIATEFEMSADDAEYFVAYVRWLRDHGRGLV